MVFWEAKGWCFGVVPGFRVREWHDIGIWQGTLPKEGPSAPMLPSYSRPAFLSLSGKNVYTRETGGRREKGARCLMQHQRHTSSVALVCVAVPEDMALLAHWETHLSPLQQTGLLTCWSKRHLM